MDTSLDFKGEELSAGEIHFECETLILKNYEVFISGNPSGKITAYSEQAAIDITYEHFFYEYGDRLEKKNFTAVEIVG